VITARVAVEYRGHWTAKLGDFDVYGKFLAYKFSENRSFALLVLVSPEIDMSLEMLSEQTTIQEMEVLDRTSPPWTLKESSLLLISSKYREIPPMELLTYEGFNPLGDPLLEDGRMYFDLFLTNQEALAHAVALLENYGDVSVEHLSENFKYQSIPKTSGFEQLLNDFVPDQLETLSVAVEKGYFDDARDTTVSEIAAEIGTDPSTVSRRLRKARLRTLQFVMDYLPEDDPNTE
jgi:hypothetical protein